MNPIVRLASSLRIARLVDHLDNNDWDSAWAVLSALESYLATRFDPQSIQDSRVVAELRKAMEAAAANDEPEEAA